MEGDALNMNSGNNEESKGKTPRAFWLVIALLVFFVFVIGVYAYWNANYSPEARSARETKKQYEQYEKGMKEYEEAMKADTYGGKTPEETLQMFIEALKAGDVELASKYFALGSNGESYLNRKKWEDGLRKAKEEGRLEEIVGYLSQMQPAGSSMEGQFGFEIRDKNTGDLLYDAGLSFNGYSQVWKIESL